MKFDTKNFHLNNLENEFYVNIWQSVIGIIGNIIRRLELSRVAKEYCKNPKVNTIDARENI